MKQQKTRVLRIFIYEYTYVYSVERVKENQKAIIYILNKNFPISFETKTECYISYDYHQQNNEKIKDSTKIYEKKNFKNNVARQKGKRMGKRKNKINRYRSKSETNHERWHIKLYTNNRECRKQLK